MNTAVVHYHLNRGGVAQVVANQLLALDKLPAHLAPGQVVLCYGGRREGWPDNLAARLRQIELTQSEIPELDYDEGTNAVPQPDALADRLQSRLRKQGCTAENTLLHIHNHALGKNVSLPGAVCQLAKNGFRLLLQLHDFAEDFRAANYGRLRAALTPGETERLPHLLYPQGRHIHYAVLNRRDETVLRTAGVAATQLHLLPNPVQPPERLTGRVPGRARLAERFGIRGESRYVLYPVRGIRRKNLGETLLWAALTRDVAVFGVTLAPLNPLERNRYARWRAVASALHLPCIFEVGGEDGLTLAENFAACDRVLTTSLAEGFGLVFLEACLSQRPLIGRDLPEVTSDFVQRGVTFAGLHSRVDVPVAWLGRQKLLDMLARAFNSTVEAYGRRPFVLRDQENILDRRLRNDCIDFGDLDAVLQERVLRTVCSDARCSETLLQINPWIRDTVTNNDAEYLAEAERNAAVVQREYSMEITGRRLSDIYQSVMASPRDDSLTTLTAGEHIVDAFLSLSRFRPVRR